jgi:hypothetical protein
MYIGHVFCLRKEPDRVYVRINSYNGIETGTETLCITKGNSIVALCDPNINDNGTPTINRFSFDEMMDNIIGDGDEADFDDDLRYICGISIV